MKRKLIAPFVSVAAAAALLMPATPAASAETCHPPNYDTVHCACVAVGRIWIKLTGGEWYCGV